MAMELAAYLKRERKTYSAFGLLIGTNHARTVERYAKGKQRPNAVMMQRITLATSGEVTPNDFFRLDQVAVVEHDASWPINPLPTGSAAAHD
jgi:hypothetical protein